MPLHQEPILGWSADRAFLSLAKKQGFTDWAQLYRLGPAASPVVLQDLICLLVNDTIVPQRDFWGGTSEPQLACR